MVDSTISGLDPADVITGGECLPIDQDGYTLRTTPLEIASFMAVSPPFDVKLDVENPDFTGTLSTDVFIAPQLTADVNDWQPDAADLHTVWAISADAPRSISGIVGGLGRFLYLSNIGNQPITLLNVSSASAIANQFNFGGIDFVLQPLDGILLMRFGVTTQRWKALDRVSATGGGGGGALEDLTNVDITGVVTGRMLKYDGAIWVDGLGITDIATSERLKVDDEGLITIGTNGVRLAGDASYTYFTGGTTSALGGNIYLYGPSHGSAPGRVLIRSGTSDGIKVDPTLVTLSLPTTGTLDDHTITGTVTVGDTFSPAILTADAHDWSPDAGDLRTVWNITADAPRTITGIANRPASFLYLVNRGLHNITLANNSTLSTNINRFQFGGGTDVVLRTNDAILLNSNDSGIARRWRAFGAPLAGLLDDAVMTGSLSFGSVCVITDLTGTVNDYQPDAADQAIVWRITPTGPATITGIAGAIQGRLLIISNLSGTNSITLLSENSGSLNANRLWHGLAHSSLTLLSRQTATYIYDNSRWELIGSTAMVFKSGDTMTGLLTLSGAPTVDLHAATKKYVDDSVIAAGAVTTLDTLTDVDTTGVVTGSMLKYSGTNWVDGFIVDLTTGERFKIENGALTVGAAGGANFDIKQANDTVGLFLSGGTAQNVGGNILLYGSTNAGNPSRVSLRNNTTDYLTCTPASGVTVAGDPSVPLGIATKQYVDAVELDDLANVDTTGKVAGQLLRWNGTDWVDGVGFQDQAGGLRFTLGNQTAVVGGPTTDFTFLNFNDTTFTQIAGGTTAAGSGNVACFGPSHASAPNEVWIRRGATNHITVNAAGVDFPQTTTAVTQATADNTQKLATTAFVKAAIAAGGGALDNLTDVDTTGVATGNMLKYISGSGWVDGFLVDNTTVERFNIGNTTCTYGGTVGATFSFRQGTDTEWVNFSGGTTASLGGNIYCYGSIHASFPNRVNIRSGADSGIIVDPTVVTFGLPAALTGVSTATTAVNGTNTTQIATTAYCMAMNLGDLANVTIGGAVVEGNYLKRGATEWINAEGIVDLATAARIKIENAALTLGGNAVGWNVNYSRDDSYWSLSGGISQTVGGNIFLYGGTYAGVPNRVLIRCGLTNALIIDPAGITCPLPFIDPSITGKIQFDSGINDKIQFYSNTFGMGVEGGTLTSWAGTRHRWRIGGTSATTGVERMSLIDTGLVLSTDMTSTASVRAAEYLRAGSIAAPVNTDTGTITCTRLNFGNGAQGNVTIRVDTALSTGPSAHGIYQNGQIQSGVTTAAYYNRTHATVENATFTLNDLYHYYADAAVFGASATVTAQTGYYVHTGMVGATNTYGFRGALNAATNAWNIYMGGTARNYMTGALSIGDTTDPGTSGIYALGDVWTANVKLAGSTSGRGTLSAPAAASTYVWTLPASTSTLATQASVDAKLPLTGGTLSGALTISGNIATPITLTRTTSAAVIFQMNTLSTSIANHRPVIDLRVAADAGGGVEGVIATGQNTGSLRSWAYDGAVHKLVTTIETDVIAATPSSTDMESRIFFTVCPAASVADTEIMRLEHRNGMSMYGGNAVIDNNRHFRLRSYTIATLPSDKTTGQKIACSDLGGGARELYADGTNWRRVASDSYAAVATNADFTLTVLSSAENQRHTGTLTAARAVTLSTTNAYAGARFRITRTGTGAFNLNVGTGPLKGLVTNTWCEVIYDGTAWYLAAYGAL